MSNFLDPNHLVKDFGYLGIFITLFLESGVFFGFFLPGDSLLFTAGLLASQGYLNIVGLVVISVIAAILGNNVGYYTGKKVGPALFSKKKSFLFSPRHITEAHSFFEKEGPQSLILARFIPAIRTFVPIAAGIGKMNYRKFLVFNGLGGLFWGIGVPVLGYTLGKKVPNIDKYLLPIILVIIMLSALPVLFAYFKSRRSSS
ncbi:MAG: DedA family protein [bacterium]|nr:DedA family protein [bacterium]